MADAYGLRIAYQIGPARILRAVALVVFVGCVVIWAVGRPLLLDPTAIGSDPSNYYAAGLRLNAGHALYTLTLGDRPVPLTPPFVAVPLLSPPFVAVIWRVLAILPGDAAMYLWWMAGFTAIAATTIWTIRNGSATSNAVVVMLAPWLALTAWSGNVNCFVIPMLTLAWCATRRRAARAGALMAVAAMLKVTPVFFGVWLLLHEPRRGVVGFLVVAAACAAASIVGAGIQAHLTYLDIIATTGTVGATQYSLPGFLAGFGADPWLVVLAIPALAAAGVVAIFAMRRRPDIGFSIATLVAVYAQPSLGLHSLALLLPAVVPYTALGRPAVDAVRRA